MPCLQRRTLAFVPSLQTEINLFAVLVALHLCVLAVQQQGCGTVLVAGEAAIHESEF